MIVKGFVKIDRKITKWRWYKDTSTFKIFLHLILTANYEDREFEDIVIKRGQRVASIRSLAVESGLTEKNVRTAIKHLKATGEVASLSTPKYTVFTVVNYEKYQIVANKVANEGRTGGEQVANEGQQCKKDIIKIKKDKEYTAPSGAKKSGLGRGGGHTDF